MLHASRLGVTLATLAALYFSVSSEFMNPAGMISDSVLASASGQDFDFGRVLPTSCAAYAAIELGLANPGVTFATSCGSPNAGFPCGRCNNTNSSTFGKLASIRGDQNGQMNAAIANCGFVFSGTCEFIIPPPPLNQPQVTCSNLVNLLNGAGQPIICGNLTGIVAQGGGGGGVAD